MSENAGDDERWRLRKGGERAFALGEMMVLPAEAGTGADFVKVLRDCTRPWLAKERLRQQHRANLPGLTSDSPARSS